MKKFLMIAALSFLATPAAHAATCSATIFNQSVPFTCPDPVPGPQGEKGDTGAQGAQGQQGVAGVNGTDGKNGVDGKDGANGRDGRDFDADEALALSSAMSLPAWLGDSENFSISGGFGVSGGDTALGATGIMRISGGLAGFVGGGVTTSGDNYGVKAGLRYGW